MKKEIAITLAQDLLHEQLYQFVNEANRFGSYIIIQTDRFQINAKSILGMMVLGEMNKEEVVLSAEGTDSEQALEYLTPFLLPTH